MGGSSTVVAGSLEPRRGRMWIDPREKGYCSIWSIVPYFLLLPGSGVKKGLQFPKSKRYSTCPRWLLG